MFKNFDETDPTKAALTATMIPRYLKTQVRICVRTHAREHAHARTRVNQSAVNERRRNPVTQRRGAQTETKTESAKEAHKYTREPTNGKGQMTMHEK